MCRLNYRLGDGSNSTEAELISQDETQYKTYTALACGAIVLIIGRAVVYVSIVYRFYLDGLND